MPWGGRKSWVSPASRSAVTARLLLSVVVSGRICRGLNGTHDYETAQVTKCVVCNVDAPRVTGGGVGASVARRI
jgi:hypothetical protein